MFWRHLKCSNYYPMLTRLQLCVAFMCATLAPLAATTIVPFPTQAAMVNASDVALAGVVVGQVEDVDNGITYFGYEMLVTQGVKNAVPGQKMRVYQMSHLIGEQRLVIAGDLELQIGGEYMLFLGTTGAGHLVPLTMTYGVYERQMTTTGGAGFWVPLDHEGVELMQHPSGVEIQPLMTYPYATFDDLLRSSLRQSDFAIEAYAAPNVPQLQARAYPSGCVPLFSGQFGTVSTQGSRWINPTLAVIQRAGGDAGFGATVTATVVANAVLAMNQAYQGISLSTGAISPLPLPSNCSSVSNSLSSNGPSQSIQLYFNDPCNEVPNLSGCSGTLALGGSFFTGTHTYDGAFFASSAFGYVTVNNGASCLGQSNYARMLEHEMTHAMGLGHIPASQFPNQNMNASCCNAINTRDIICMNYLYAPVVLPVELAQLSVRPENNGARLSWTTTAEHNSDRFDVQRADDGSSFVSIGNVDAAGTSDKQIAYSYLDRAPLDGINYYLLRQLDRDGVETFSEVVALELGVEHKLVVVPNPATVGSSLMLSGMSDDKVLITVSDVAGREVYRLEALVTGGRAELVMPQQLPAGMYYVRTRGAQEVMAQAVQLK